MGGKKKKGAGKKKGKGGDDDGEIDSSVLNDILTSKVLALKSRLVLEQNRRDNAESNVEEIRESGDDMKGDMDKHHEHTREMVGKMTQIYKSMEKQYNETIDESELEVDGQEKKKKQLKEEIAQL